MKLVPDCSHALLRVFGAFFLPVLLLSSGLTGCGVSVIQVDAAVKVSPLDTEDLDGSCAFDIVLAKDKKGKSLTQQGALVIYEREDTSKIFSDQQVREMAARLSYSLIFAHECNAASHDDFQTDPAAGPGRALVAGIDQLAQVTQHPELSQAKIIVYGFSAGGLLALQLPDYAPNRIWGVIAYAPASVYQNIEELVPQENALKTPSLILAGSEDDKAGTTRPLHYFHLGREQNSPWAYAVQKGLSHCCSLMTKPLLLAWVPAVVALHSPPKGSGIAIGNDVGVITSFVCTSDGETDAFGEQDCSFTSAALSWNSDENFFTAWLPDNQSAAAWLSWVTTPAPR